MRVRFPFLLATVLAVASLAAALPSAVTRASAAADAPGAAAPAAAPGRAARQPAAAKPKPDRRVTLDEAVRIGILDEAVLRRLRDAGKVEAILSLDASDIIATAEVDTGRLKGRHQVKAKLEAMGRGFAARRDTLLKRVARGVEVLETWQYLDVARIRITQERALLALVNDGAVEGVTGIRTAAPALAESLPIIGQPAVKAAGHEGLGTYVAVLDTGVNYPGWPTFFPTGSVPFETDTVTNDGVRDDHGHGTHVASTVLAVAPKTKILAYDVFFRTNTGCRQNEAVPCVRSNSNYQIPAIQDVLAKRAAGTNVVALNMSIGGGWYTSCTDYLGLESLRAVGIIPAISASNDYTTVENGVTVARAGIGSPACIPAAVAVGATTDGRFWGGANPCSSGPDAIASYSQTTTATNATYGAQLDVLAPGSCITAAHGTKNGTSMAAPHVAGAVAVLRAAAAFPATAAGALNVEAYLEYYGKPITDTRALAGNLTRPRLDLGAAIRALSGTVDATPPVIAPIATEIVPDTQLTQAGGVTTRIRWSATDPSGIKQYTFWWRVDDGAWTQQVLPSLLTSSWTYVLDPNRKWEFAVRAWDGRDNASEFTYTLVRHLVYQESHASTVYNPLASWPSASRSDCLGGAMRVASSTGSRAVFTFTNAKQVAWVATTNVDRGHAYRWLDGRGIGWLDLYSATLRRRVAVAVFGVPTYTAQHTVELYVYGTAGRPYVDIDAWVVMQDR